MFERSDDGSKFGSPGSLVAMQPASELKIDRNSSLANRFLRQVRSCSVGGGLHDLHSSVGRIASVSLIAFQTPCTRYPRFVILYSFGRVFSEIYQDKAASSRPGSEQLISVRSVAF